MMTSPTRCVAAFGLLLLLASSVAAATRAWEIVIPDASEEAFVVLNSTGNPRVVSRNNSGLLRYAALSKEGDIVATGVFPAAADGLFRGPSAAAATSDGGAASCGSVTTPALFPAFPTADGLVVRFSPAGSPIWSKVLGDSELGLCGLHSLSGCARTSGAIYAVGSAAPIPFPPVPGPPPTCPFIPANFNAFLVRLDEAGGAVTGLKTFSIPAGEAVYGAVASSGGAVYALGSRGSSMIVDKYDADLNLVWSATATTSGLTPIAVAVSSQGVIAALGQRGTLDARVIRLAPNGSVLGEAIVVFPETSGIALTDGSTSYVSGRRSSHAALASAAPTDAVAVEFDDAAAQRYMSVAVDSRTGVFVGVERISDVRVARFGEAGGDFTLEVSTRSNQIGTPTLPADVPLEVRLSSGTIPLSGTTVEFRITGFPPQAMNFALSPSNFNDSPPPALSTYTLALTGGDGRAQAWFLFGNRIGTYTVTATCSACGASSGTFTLAGRLMATVSPTKPSIQPRPRIGPISESATTLQIELSGPRADGSTRPVANYPVIFIGTAVALSGGHTHDADRPIGVLSGAGLTIATTPATASGRTDPTGQLSALYTATYFSGFETFFARSGFEPDIVFASTTIAIELGGLSLLPAATFYAKVGGTAFHRGPPSSSQDENHFAQAAFVAISTMSFAEFDAKFPARTLSVNDMALPFGGQFDIGPTSSCRTGSPVHTCRFWEPPHVFHRLGKAADINLDIPGGLDRSANTREERELTAILRGRGIQIFVEGDHWHIYLQGDGP